MAASNNIIDRSISIPTQDPKQCSITYTRIKYNRTVIATGYQITLEDLRLMYPEDNIQVCQENNIEYYKTTSQEGPQFFVYQKDGLIDKAYYWDNGCWHGYRSLKKVDFPTVHATVPVSPQSPADDRL